MMRMAPRAGRLDPRIHEYTPIASTAIVAVTIDEGSGAEKPAPENEIK